MKKLLSLLLLLATVLTLVSCGGERGYKLGMGTVSAVTAAKDGTLTATVTAAAVLLSPDGRIVACKIDVAESKLSAPEGVLPDLSSLSFQTKKEKGDAYGMLAYGGSKAEWYAEVAALESFLIGKSKRDVAFLPAREENGGLYAVDEALTASCTIEIGDMLSAVKKALADTHACTFTETPASLSLSLLTTAGDSHPADAASNGRLVLTTALTATAYGADGHALASLLDTAEGSAALDGAGRLSAASSVASKRASGAEDAA